MIKIMFVCLGNICRSPMAECVMNDMLKKRGLDNAVRAFSSATSQEEIGNPVYPPAVRKLKEEGVPVIFHRATQLVREDKDRYDYFVGMETRNLTAMKRILGDGVQVFRLLDFSASARDIADPWWTGNFDATYNDVKEGCEALVEHILKTDLKKL